MKVLCWVAVVYAWVIARMIQWRAFNKADPAPTDMRPWRLLGIAGSAIAGLIWGIGAVVLYVPGGLEYQLFLVMGLVGMGAGCVYASASVMPSFFAYFHPSILLPAFLFIRVHEPLHLITGAMMLVYLALMTPFALRVYRLIDESIQLRFENFGLIGELREQKETAEDANVAKSRFLAAASHDLRQPLLARIIRNLLSNAVCYTDSGGVVLGCRRAGPDVRIEVWDTGKGIPADRHDEVFREFYQLDNPERDRRKGLGLGLAIVKRLARLLNYRIAVRSAVGNGSMFSITLPRGHREDYSPEERSPSPRRSTSHTL